MKFTSHNISVGGLSSPEVCLAVVVSDSVLVGVGLWRVLLLLVVRFRVVGGLMNVSIRFIMKSNVQL